MKGAVVSGLGWVTAAGFGSGRIDGPFSWGTGNLPPITRSHVSSRTRSRFGRLDRYSRLGMAAIAMALHDAGIGPKELQKTAAGLIASTVYGCLETDIDFLKSAQRNGGREASPHLFAFTLSNTFLGEAAIEFGFTGVTYMVNEPRLTGSAALFMSLEAIAGGEGDIVVTGLCDLGAPALFPAVDVRAGALFLVLTKIRAGAPDYGCLTAEKGGMAFEGENVGDMIELAEALSGKRR